jgi:hypothetical protein
VLPMLHPLSAKVGTNFADKRRSVGIVRLRTRATEFSFLVYVFSIWYNTGHKEYITVTTVLQLLRVYLSLRYMFTEMLHGNAEGRGFQEHRHTEINVIYASSA